MKANPEKRIIHWNRRAEKAPENIYTWYFLIVNEVKMIERIKQRLYQQLQPTDEPVEYVDSTLKREDLRVLCFSVESPKLELDFKRVYGGKWRREQELYYRPKIDNLIERLIS